MADEKSRLPRGTHTVADAFLEAVDAVPAKSRQDVAKAALGIIKTKLASRKADARSATPVTKKPATLRRAAARPIARPAKTATKAQPKSVVRKIAATKPKLTLVQTKPRPAAAA